MAGAGQASTWWPTSAAAAEFGDECAAQAGSPAEAELLRRLHRLRGPSSPAAGSPAASGSRSSACSNGGLLIGAVLHPVVRTSPDAVAAAVPVIGHAAGQRPPPTGGSTRPSTAPSRIRSCSRRLLAYSPYRDVVDGTAYPAVLLTAGRNDTRVDAWHAKEDDGPAPAGHVLGPAGAAEIGVHRPSGRVARPGHRCRYNRLARLPLRPARPRLPPAGGRRKKGEKLQPASRGRSTNTPQPR